MIPSEALHCEQIAVVYRPELESLNGLTSAQLRRAESLEFWHILQRDYQAIPACTGVFKWRWPVNSPVTDFNSFLLNLQQFFGFVHQGSCIKELRMPISRQMVETVKRFLTVELEGSLQSPQTYSTWALVSLIHFRFTQYISQGLSALLTSHPWLDLIVFISNNSFYHTSACGPTYIHNPKWREKMEIYLCNFMHSPLVHLISTLLSHHIISVLISVRLTSASGILRHIPGLSVCLASWIQLTNYIPTKSLKIFSSTGSPLGRSNERVTKPFNVRKKKGF
jgi:hypothetical protein